MDNRQQPNVNHQDHPHQEGQQNNTAVSDPGQRNSGVNNNQPMSNMLNESAEQKAGEAHGQKDESNVQQGERRP